MQDSRLRRHKLGFWELAQKPSAAELAAYYEKNYFQNELASYSKSYSTLETQVIDLRISLRAAQVAEITGRTTSGSMLDVGCGEGFVMRHFSSLGWQVAGIDFSRAGVDHHNPEYAHLTKQGDVFQLLAEKIDTAEQHDVVWLGNVLEHVLDPVGLLQSLRQLVRPDGLLVVTVPNDGSAYQESLLESGTISERFWIAVPDHISYFSVDSLRHTAEATGWQCLGLQGDFPIDLFLAHPGANYVADRTCGPAAHHARLKLEELIGQSGHAPANRFYTALADVGLGRNLTAYLRSKPEAF
jgi:2-polyprenyl-3-methyl-5-hydroxy-6-metoxy-1,4-benzoquinol methylase